MLVIYSKDNCQQCDSAKLLCQMKGVEYAVKTLDIDYTKEQLMHVFPKARSFPIIADKVKYDGVEMEEYIGGLVELKEVLATKYSK